MWHYQCLMEKKIARTQSKYTMGGKCVRIGWIPEKFAVLNQVLELKEENGTWSNGWVVKQIGARKGSEEVNERSRDYKKQRKASDRPRKVKK